MVHIDSTLKSLFNNIGANSVPYNQVRRKIEGKALNKILASNMSNYITVQSNVNDPKTTDLTFLLTPI